MNNEEVESSKPPEKVVPIPVNQFGYLTIFPDGFCICGKVSKDRKESYIILRFYTVENGMRIPIGTYILPIGMARKLVEVIKHSIEKIEEEQPKEENEKIK